MIKMYLLLMVTIVIMGVIILSLADTYIFLKKPIGKYIAKQKQKRREARCKQHVYQMTVKPIELTDVDDDEYRHFVTGAICPNCNGTTVVGYKRKKVKEGLEICK